VPAARAAGLHLLSTMASAKAAAYLPAGQTLESREVTGSLRTGGRIGWLRWQSESLAVEVREAKIGWQLAPLFERKVQLGEVHAAQLLIERRGPPSDKPAEPLEKIVLPVEVDLPFRIDDLRWAGGVGGVGVSVAALAIVLRR
ncbi:hypothetical protein ACEN8K_09610, partial [Variovorax sp. CT11-76]